MVLIGLRFFSIYKTHLIFFKPFNLCHLESILTLIVNQNFTDMKKLYYIFSTLLIATITFGCAPDKESTMSPREVLVDQYDNLKTYPNPATEFLYLENAKGAVVDIVHLSGRKVWSRKITQTRISIDVNEWEVGTYIMRIRGERGFKTKKIIVN